MRDEAVAQLAARTTLKWAWSFAVVWFSIAWDSVPEEDRHYTQLGRYTAFSATVRLFVPFYDLYWYFRALSLLCGSINDSLARRELTMRAPLAVANIAFAVPIVSD